MVFPESRGSPVTSETTKEPNNNNQRKNDKCQRTCSKSQILVSPPPAEDDSQRRGAKASLPVAVALPQTDAAAAAKGRRPLIDLALPTATDLVLNETAAPPGMNPSALHCRAVVLPAALAMTGVKRFRDAIFLWWCSRKSAWVLCVCVCDFVVSLSCPELRYGYFSSPTDVRPSLRLSSSLPLLLARTPNKQARPELRRW